jgi:signal transduction histidine kinase
VDELATTRERNRLAREVHDSLGHYLTAVNMQLEAARLVLTRDPAKAAEALTRAQTLTKDGLGEVRRSVAKLRQGPLDNKTLPQALEALAAESRASGIDTTISLEGSLRPLAPQAELTLYRTVQEALTNSRKHAQPRRIDVTLSYDDAWVTARVRNDGSPPQASDALTSGFGLLGLRERAQLLGGTVTIERAGDVFELTLTLPKALTL